MMKLITLLMVATLPLTSPSAAAQQKIPILFDTDFGPDYDDVGAIALLHAFADSGYVDILATGASSKYENAAAALCAFNTYFGRPDVPVGVVKGKALDLGDWQHWSDSVIANYPHRIKSNDEAPDAVEVYRRTLSEQRDFSVTIITVGFFTNMAHLLQSPPDNLSPLNGMELVKRKVRHLVSMAGRMPSGFEFNVSKDPSSSRYVFKYWPTPILFSGFEIGAKIHCGLPLIHNEAIRHDPVKDVFSIAIPKAPEDSAGRMSWDETAVLIAVKGWASWYSVVPGRMRCDEDGKDDWDPAGSGHLYIKEVAPPAEVQARIDRLIQHQPVYRAAQ
ncbi:MAG: nucleoside hydrolase [Bacteroidota bacterium]|nr:nucleoside hydrolase [Bacteroidota bacterium]